MMVTDISTISLYSAILIGVIFSFYPAVLITYRLLGTNPIKPGSAAPKTGASRIVESAVNAMFNQLTNLLQTFFLLFRFGREPDSHTIVTATIDDLKDFKALSKNLSYPVVIRGALKETKACKEWNLDYFEENYGDREIIYVTDNSLENTRRTLGREGKRVEGDVKQLSAVINDIRQGGKQYISNLSGFMQDNPELVKATEIEALTKQIKEESRLSNFEHLIAQIFVGNSRSVSALHCAMMSNLFVNVCGQKKWTFIHPKYTCLLKPYINRYNFFAISGQDTSESEDFIRHIPHIDVTLNPGDVLFVPSWWWHKVYNQSDVTIAIANRIYPGLKSILFANPTFTLLNLASNDEIKRENLDDYLLKTFISMKPTKQKPTQQAV